MSGLWSARIGRSFFPLSRDQIVLADAQGAVFLFQICAGANKLLHRRLQIIQVASCVVRAVFVVHMRNIERAQVPVNARRTMISSCRPGKILMKSTRSEKLGVSVGFDLE